MRVTTPNGTYDISDYESFVRFLNQNQDWDGLQHFIEVLTGPGNGYIGARTKEWYNNWLQQREALAAATESGDWSGYQQTVSQNGIDLSPEQTEYMNNQIANQRTEEAREYDTTMRDTSLLSAADQLSQLGLSTSNVINTGGASSSGVGTAAVSNRNHSGQMALARYNQKMNMARSMIGMVSAMGSAGIHGAAFGAAKHTAAALAAAGAHSGLRAMRVGPSIPQVQKAFGLGHDAPDFGGDNSNFF